MTDIFDAEKRSDIMRQVKSQKNKSAELRLIEICKQNGITGWRRNYPVKGHPDFVFPEKKIAVFVDGCFWHGHDCRLNSHEVKSNKEFWRAKIERNKARDERNHSDMIAMGFRVIVVWECALAKAKDVPSFLVAFEEEIRKGRNTYVEFPLLQQ